MIIDASAVIAVVKREPEASYFNVLIESDDNAKMSVVNFLEAAIILDRSEDPRHSHEFDEFMHLAEIEILPVTVDQGHIARRAYRDFGRGSGHKARLNLGDCFAYALAKSRHEPLLFKGNDFPETDVQIAAEKRS